MRVLDGIDRAPRRPSPAEGRETGAVAVNGLSHWLWAYEVARPVRLLSAARRSRLSKAGAKPQSAAPHTARGPLGSSLLPDPLLLSQRGAYLRFGVRALTDGVSH